jgi:hypothetical protein
MIKRKFLLLFIWTISCAVFSQEKFEKEYRVKPSEVPEKSFKLIKSWRFKKKVKWYAEESNDGKTFEAKTVHLNHVYSIEFNENGTLLDLEKKVSFSELEKKIQV